MERYPCFANGIIGFFGLLFVLPVMAAPQDQQIFTNFESAPNASTFTIGASPNTATFNGNVGFRATGALYNSGIRAFWIEPGETGSVTFATPAETR